jgi:hypothetical protein
MLLIIRMIENVPKVTPAQKGRNPGPGDRKVPIFVWMDITQTKIEMASQKKLLNWSREFIMLLYPRSLVFFIVDEIVVQRK